MEFIVCMLLAALLGGGRIGADIVHAVKGTTPPHVEKARLKAQQQKPSPHQSPYAGGKPRLKDVAAVYWGDAMADTIAAHDRRRAEKAAQKSENVRAAAAGEQPERLRPSVKDRVKRVGRLLVDPVGEKPAPTGADSRPRANPKPAPGDSPGSARTGADLPAVPPTSGTVKSTCPRCGAAAVLWRGLACEECIDLQVRRGVGEDGFMARLKWMATPDSYRRPGESTADYDTRLNVELDRIAAEHNPAPTEGEPMTTGTDSTGGENINAPHGDDLPSAVNGRRTGNHAAGQPSPAPPARDFNDIVGSGAGAPSGEAVNYETTVAELEALIARIREHLDSVTAALVSVQQAKININNSQASYNPAANAAASISEHLPALNVDAETVGHTGTVANAMPPNAVNDMFDRLEAMEQALIEQRANAEAALGSAEQALKTVQEKYGDAHATVAGELSGDSRFLADSAA